MITLARKPLIGSVADNVLQHGTGGLNVDGSRINYQGDLDKASATPQGRCTSLTTGVRMTAPNLEGGIRGGFERPGQGGRWPSNVILEHRPECRCVGTKKVAGSSCKKSHVGMGSADKSRVYGQAPSVVTAAYVDEDGTEEISAWDCHPDCPIAVLDDQSGVLKSGAWSGVVNSKRVEQVAKGAERERVREDREADEGGASRFFKQVKVKL